MEARDKGIKPLQPESKTKAGVAQRQLDLGTHSKPGLRPVSLSWPGRLPSTPASMPKPYVFQDDD
jgi:hypothetical protein